MDIIKIQGLHIYGYHGVHDEEKDRGQNFYVNAQLEVDTFAASQSDNLDNTVSYSDVCKLIYNDFLKEKYDLIETVAEKLAERILASFPKVRAVTLEVQKPEAPIGLPVEYVSVAVSRSWHRVLLSVGSNIGDRQGYINRAIKELEEDKVHIRLKKVSDMIVTKPYGGVEQDDFINGAIEIETILSPQALLSKIHEIEKDCGRERLIHWGPRTLDLDILFYDDLIMDSPELTIPHIDMKNREFVLNPLSQIVPNLIHPVTGQSIKQMYDYLLAANSAAEKTEG